MADGKGGPELSWQTIVGALSGMAILGAAGWTIFQNEFASFQAAAVADRAHVVQLQASFGKYLTIREHDEYRSGIRVQLDELRARTATVEAAVAKGAREPVEDKTFQAVSKATDDRITLLQSQITDINRQIAAALIIIDQNAAGIQRRPTPQLPP